MNETVEFSYIRFFFLVLDGFFTDLSGVGSKYQSLTLLLILQQIKYNLYKKKSFIKNRLLIK